MGFFFFIVILLFLLHLHRFPLIIKTFTGIASDIRVWLPGWRRGIQCKCRSRRVIRRGKRH